MTKQIKIAIPALVLAIVGFTAYSSSYEEVGMGIIVLAAITGFVAYRITLK